MGKEVEEIGIDLVQDAKNFIGQANSLRGQLNSHDQERNAVIEQMIRVDAILAFIRNKIGSSEFDKIVTEVNEQKPNIQVK